MRCIPVGKVVAEHGLRGEVKFKYYNEVAEGFLEYTSLYAERNGKQTELKPAGIRFQKGFFYIKFEGLDRPDMVSFLMNQELCVREEDLPPLDNDEYYDYQLIGLDVINLRGEKIGKVEQILHTGANDVMAVTGAREIFVPMVDGYISKIDLGSSCVMIDEDALLV
ncbi:MAG: Ribosome maturation factor RimM [Syntrophorhabdus sp. PtaU1.Bin050]|nr:MAG: Ribosome maturation factor RimM [Syntrophorhabdus sp. PtaU1.Bin050]